MFLKNKSASEWVYTLAEILRKSSLTIIDAPVSSFLQPLSDTAFFSVEDDIARELAEKSKTND